MRQADGSMQAVPRIIIRTTTPPATSAAPAPLQHSPPSQQGGYPVVLNSRVVRESTPDPSTCAGPPPSYAHWAEQQQQQQQHQHQYPHSQYGMHQYQEQQPQSSARTQQTQGQTQAYMQQTSHARVSLAQHQHQPPQQLQYALQQLPQQGQKLPRPGSFQELLSAPLVPEPYTGVPANHDPASRLTAAAASRTKRTQQAPFEQPAAAYASQGARQPPSAAADTAQLAQNPGAAKGPGIAQTPGMAQNPGMATIAASQHMFLQQHGDASQRPQQQQQQQQHSLGALPYAMSDRPSSSQLLMQTSSAMYPPIQYPQAVGAFPMLPKTSTGSLSPGHPYHGYHTCQAAGSVTGPLQLQQQPQLLTHQQQPQQQQKQQQRQLFQPYLQPQPGLPDHLSMQMPMQSAVHQYQQQQQQQSAVHEGAATPTAGFASPEHRQMAQVQIGSVTYDPPQRLGQPPESTPISLAAFQARPGDQFYPSHLRSFHHGSQQSDRVPQQPPPPSQHAHPAQNSSVSHTPDMSYPSQRGAGAAITRGEGSGGVPWGSLQGVVPGPTYAPMGQAGGPSPAGSAGGSANQQQMSGLLLPFHLKTFAVVVPAWVLVEATSRGVQEVGLPWTANF